MSTETVTGTAVWEALNQNAKFQAWPEAAREAARPFVEAMPAVLADRLDQPLTFFTALAAQNEYIMYLLEQDYHAAKAAAENPGADVSRTITIEQMKAFGMLRVTMQMAQYPEDTLETMEMTEEEVLLSPEVGLTELSRERYHAGGYTIGQLMLDDPSQFFALDDIAQEIADALAQQQ